MNNMQMRLKNLVIMGMLTALVIPFVWLTDIYPFFRFGMFAEPVKQEIQLEQFAIRYLKLHQQAHLLDPREIGLSSLSYLMRNYYYRNQSVQFLKHIHQVYGENKEIKEWQLLRITSTAIHPSHTDTVIVANFRLVNNQ